MRCPVNYVSVTQEFGKHKGVDLGWAAHRGQPIYACEDGVVIYNRHQITGGYVIHIRHDNGYVSEYGHLKKDSQLVHEGDHVKKGQQIASMGATGIVTGEHLHFGLYKGTKINYNDKSKFVNPLKYINLYEGQVAYNKKAEQINRTKRTTAKDGLNVRKGPHVSYDIVETLPYNSQVENYGKKNGWLCIDNIKNYYVAGNWVK